MGRSQRTSVGMINGARHSTPNEVLVEAIVLTSEVCGRALSLAAASLLAQDLADFDEAAILAALGRCRMELQGALRTVDILARLDDGRPDVDEAWAMMPRSESASVVWTAEMAQAWGLAWPLMGAGDAAGARAAFREEYLRAVQSARLGRIPVRWLPSLGSDLAGREAALLHALQLRRLSPDHVAKLLPPGAESPKIHAIVARLKLKKFH
ncbi:MAG: hypothetical protein JWQ23_2555 [Herminiimonas sp.]|nr:hypothetical protein [Herminiimonas sp.]